MELGKLFLKLRKRKTSLQSNFVHAKSEFDCLLKTQNYANFKRCI